MIEYKIEWITVNVKSYFQFEYIEIKQELFYKYQTFKGMFSNCSRTVFTHGYFHHIYCVLKETSCSFNILFAWHCELSNLQITFFQDQHIDD